jgi:hypothetical protein
VSEITYYYKHIYNIAWQTNISVTIAVRHISRSVMVVTGKYDHAPCFVPC